MVAQAASTKRKIALARTMMASQEHRSPVVVQKYGGTSVGSPRKIVEIADRTARAIQADSRLVIILSAMGKTTDDLVELANTVSRNPAGREMDLLLATGEQISVSLLGIALQDRGVPAISLTASQCGIRTDDAFNIARIQSIDTARIHQELDAGRVVIITGFQGITETHEVTTLGRGGSDVTGAAMAAALGASVCEIYTDVDGVFSADPRLISSARRWSEISFEEAIELASSGAKVLHPRAAEVCMSYGIPIHVRSSITMQEGTWIRRESEMVMEKAAVVGVTSNREIAKITLLDVPDRPGLAATVFTDLADKDISVRFIIQSESSEGRGRITFVLDEIFVRDARELVPEWKRKDMASEVLIEQNVANLSIVGSRLASTPGLAARMFNVLGQADINIDCISSSEMKIACVISAERLEEGIKVVHDEFFSESNKSRPKTSKQE